MHDRMNKDGHTPFILVLTKSLSPMKKDEGGRERNNRSCTMCAEQLVIQSNEGYHAPE
jgi:hypothetical protein